MFSIFFFPFSVFQIDKIVHKYRVLFHAVYELAHKINRHFSAMALITIAHLATTTVAEIINCFEALKNPMKDDFAVELLLKLQSLPWSFLGLIFLMLMFYPCSNVRDMVSF